MMDWTRMMIKKFIHSTWFVPLSLLALAIICFGWMLPWLGFYWDDWFFAYSTHVFGPGGFGTFMAHDRPPSQYYYAVLSFLLGENPLAYQIYTLLLRWLCALAVWWFIGQAWPGRQNKYIWAPFLFLVFPGFSQQPIAFTYAVHWGGFLLTILSLGLMVLALRSPNKYWLWTGFAVLLATSIFSIEYQFGLELTRPLIIWFILRKTIPQKKTRLLAVLRHWLPYLAVTGAYLLWRGVLFKSNLLSAETVESFKTGPLPYLLNFAQTAFQDFFKVTLAAWITPLFSLTTLDLKAKAEWIYWGLVVLIGVVSILIFNWRKPQDLQSQHEEPDATLEVTLLGAWALLGAEAPFFISLFPHELVFPYDRFSLPMMFGVCLLLGGLLEWLVRCYRQKMVIAAVLIAFASGSLFETANTFRREWDNLGTFLWQVSWRIPALEPDTLLLTYDLPFQYHSDYSLTAPLNWMYSPGQKDEHLPFMMYYIKSRLGSSGLQKLAPDVAVEKDLRNFIFRGNTSQTVLFHYSPPGCFRVLDASRPEEYPDMPESLADASALARTDLIRTDAARAAVPPNHYWPEAVNGWCYYYEKADLARQKQDWDAVTQLGDTALNLESQTGDPSEYLVFLEGYTRAGQMDKAQNLSRKILEMDAAFKPRLCLFWQRMTGQAETRAGAEEWLETLDCGL